MLVKGKSAEQNPTALLSQLSSLSSSFPEYLGTKLQYAPPKEVVGLYNQGQQFLQQGNREMALQQFQAAESRMPKNQPNNQFLGSIYSNIASIQQTQGNYKDAEANYKKSISICIEGKDYFTAESSYKALANIHKANGTLERYDKENQALLDNSLKNNDQLEELKARLALGGINRAQGMHKDALGHYSKAYDLQQGKVDYEAVRVEQHEVGFSDKKIGTDNIQQCVAVILHDPITKKTALAHVDIYTDTKSLAQVIANFPPGTKLEAHLVGGRDRSPQSKTVSDNNINRVLSELGNHATVDIKSADIGDKGAPSGIVFDPQTGKLEHAVPGKHHETTDARKLLHNLKPPLNYAFDLTKSPEMRGPVLTDLDKERLVHRYLSTPKMLTNNTMETWNANIVYEPLAKTVEKIRLENPRIVELAIEKHLESKLGSNVSVEQKKSLLSETKMLLSEPSNSLFKIEQVVEQRIKESLPKQPKAPTIQTAMPIKGNVVTAPTISEVRQPTVSETQKDKSNWQKFKGGVAAILKVIKDVVQQDKSNWQKLKDTVVATWKIVKEVAQNILAPKKIVQPKQPDLEVRKTQTIESDPKKINTPTINQSKQKTIDPKTLLKARNIGSLVRQNMVSQPNSNVPTTTPQNPKRQQDQVNKGR